MLIDSIAAGRSPAKPSVDMSGMFAEEPSQSTVVRNKHKAPKAFMPFELDWDSDGMFGMVDLNLLLKLTVFLKCPCTTAAI